MLTGYFGRGNLGDNAMVDGLRDYLVPRLTNAVITERSLPSPRDLSAIPEFLWALACSDFVVLTGGSHFHDKYGSKSARILVQLLLVFAFARLCGAKVVFALIGIGPLDSTIGRVLTSQLLRLSYLTSVRDEASYHLAKTLRPNNTLLLGADAALLLRVGVHHAAPARTLGISVVPFNSLYFGDAAADLRMVTTLVEGLRAWHRATPDGVTQILVFCESAEYSDLEISQILLKQLEPFIPVSLVRGQDPREVMERMQGLDVLVGARFHSILLGSLCGLAVVPLIYHEKCDDLSDELGLSRNQRLSPVRLTAGEHDQHLWQTLANDPASFRPKADVDRLASLARESTDALVAVVMEKQNESPHQGFIGAALSRLRWPS